MVFGTGKKQMLAKMLLKMIRYINHLVSLYFVLSKLPVKCNVY